MKATTPHSPNAITQRLDKLSTLWQQFLALPNARVCRWLIEEDEYTLINHIFNNDRDEDINIVFEFYSPFIKIESYGKELSKELEIRIELVKEELEKLGHILNWSSNHIEDENNHAFGFINNFSSVIYSIDQLKVNYDWITIILKPTTINKNLEAWLMDVLEYDLHPKLKLMVIDRKDMVIFDKLVKTHGQLIHTIKPNLDMPSAARQMAMSSGNPNEPGVKFRNAFMDLTQAAGKLDINKVLKIETIPLSIARQNGWGALEICVIAIKGNTYLGLQKYDEALQTYDNALQLATSLHNKGDTEGSALVVQMLFSRGSTNMCSNKLEEAASDYNLAAQWCEYNQSFFQKMEAHRMEGYCLQQKGKSLDSWAAYQEALNTGEKLDEPLRLNSTLPYIGQALLDLAQRLGKKKEYFEVQEKMNYLVGNGWENLVEKRKK